MNQPSLANQGTQLESAFDYCMRICRKRARNFYYGLKLSPEPQRSALFAIYAWMRTADDLVDAAPGALEHVIHQRIANFRESTDAALAGQPPSHSPLWLALAAVADRYPVPAEHFHSMLDGQLDDVARNQYQTFDELREYCFRVASTVGLLCIEIWGYKDSAARELAVDRGIAFQLTNIIRDFKQDYDAGRVYLPQEDFAKHKMTPRELREWSGESHCLTMMNQQIQRAQRYYDQSAGLDEMITSSCRPTLWAMTSIYHGLLQKMQRDPSRVVLTKRLRLSALHKGAIAVRAKWQARSARNGHLDDRSASLSRAVSGNSTAQ